MKSGSITKAIPSSHVRFGPMKSLGSVCYVFNEEEVENKDG